MSVKLELSLQEKYINWGCLTIKCRGRYLDLWGSNRRMEEIIKLRSLIICTLP
jgi:hypothetical protein